MWERNSRVSGSMIWNSSSMPRVKTWSFIGPPGTASLLLMRDQFGSRCVETANHDFAQSLVQLVAEGQIVVPMLPQKQARQTNRRATLGGPRIKRPEIRREKPRPTERFTGRDRVDDNGFAIVAFSFQNYRAGFNEIKPAGCFPLAQNNLACIEFSRRRTERQELEMMSSHSLEKRMGRQP